VTEQAERYFAATVELLRGLSERTIVLGVLAIGVVFGAASLVVYDTSGYGTGMLLLWLTGLFTLAFLFRVRSLPLPRIARADLVAGAALMLAFAPLYLLRIYDWPVQVTTDEPTIMGVSHDYVHKAGVDPFGVSDYFIRPSLLFMVWGRIGNLIGGIDLFHMRLLHAVCGLLVIGASFALFRQFLSRGWALFAASLVGLNHALLIISRLAMRENTAVLFELVALALLVRGLRHNHAFSTYAGGVVAGFGCYVYHPSRMTFALWALFLIGLAFFYRHQFPLRRLAVLTAIAGSGFVLVGAPVLIAESKSPHIVGEADPRAQLLITQSGRELQQHWVFAPTVWDGIKTNIKFGLGTFNNHVVDHGWIYVNPGHGFVDPLTGILIWIGALVVLVRLFRRKREDEPWPMLMLGSFIVLWLAFAFLINEAPKYPRLLITLPFVAYLVTESARFLGGMLGRVVALVDPVRARRAVAAVAAGVLVAVAAGNLVIAWDYIDQGRKNGEPVGTTGRYVASHAQDSVYLVADEPGRGPYPYFKWGQPGYWKAWMSYFKPGAALRNTAASSEVAQIGAQPPFDLLMSRGLLLSAEGQLRDAYPQGRVRNVVPDGSLVAFEVPKPS